MVNTLIHFREQDWLFKIESIIKLFCQYHIQYITYFSFVLSYFSYLLILTKLIVSYPITVIWWKYFQMHCIKFLKWYWLILYNENFANKFNICIYIPFSFLSLATNFFGARTPVFLFCVAILLKRSAKTVNRFSLRLLSGL